MTNNLYKLMSNLWRAMDGMVKGYMQMVDQSDISSAGRHKSLVDLIQVFFIERWGS